MNGDDKLRLVLLYSLRYQVEGERETRFLERSLLDAGVGGGKVKAIGLLRKLAGVAVRGTDVFNKKGIMGAAKGIVKRQIQGVQGLSNVLTRYEPVLASRLAALKMGGLGALRESEFKVLGGARSGAVRPQQIVVFILGGATYAEARCVAEFNRDNTARGSPMRAVLGSNTMHSTCSYIQDILRYAPPQE